ncbi:reticulon-like protein B3 [Gossypium australe]|uniref:Reticulon-like protein B3 n=1 Tax=Gossypium australe TaxID=47621 RepID=A0A5B6UT53_9ROSI|nr:reticulon-like protein B3 [Gossypium australe]
MRCDDMLSYCMLVKSYFKSKVCIWAEKAMHEIKQQYAVFDAKVLRFQGDPLKEKKKKIYWPRCFF